MWDFTERQKAIILEAHAADDAWGDIFLRMGDSKSRSEKLTLLEEMHRLRVLALNLYASVGDPATAERLNAEEINYLGIKAHYMAMDENCVLVNTAKRDFDAACLAVYHKANGIKPRVG